MDYFRITLVFCLETHPVITFVSGAPCSISWQLNGTPGEDTEEGHHPETPQDTAGHQTIQRVVLEDTSLHRKSLDLREQQGS